MYLINLEKRLYNWYPILFSWRYSKECSVFEKKKEKKGRFEINDIQQLNLFISNFHHKFVSLDDLEVKRPSVV